MANMTPKQKANKLLIVMCKLFRSYNLDLKFISHQMKFKDLIWQNGWKSATKMFWIHGGKC